MHEQIIYIGLKIRSFHGIGEVSKLFKTGEDAGVYLVEGREPQFKTKYALRMSESDVLHHGVFCCPHCIEGDIEKVTGRPPAHPDYAQCNKCDSSYNLP